MSNKSLAELAQSLAAGESAESLISGADGESSMQPEQAWAIESTDTSADQMFDQFGVQPTETAQTKVNEQSTDESPSPTEGEPQVPPTVEKVNYTDDKGRRVFKEVDFSDRAAVRKLVEQGLGMRKFQVERDNYKKDLDQFGDVKVAQTKIKYFDEMDSIYQQDGNAGIINRLANNPNAYQQLKDEIIEEYKVRSKASPEELARLDAIARSQELERKFQQLEAKQKAESDRIKQEREQAEFEAEQSVAHSNFNKYRFAGKLGDESQEHLLDTMAWNTIDAERIKLKESGVQITPQVMEKLVRDTFVPLRDYLKKDVKVKLKEVADRTKQEAAKSVQTQIRSASVPNTSGKSVQDAYAKGSMSGLSALLGMMSNSKK